MWWSTFGPPQIAAYAALRGLLLLRRLYKLNADAVRTLINEETVLPPATAIDVAPVSLAAFDELLGGTAEVQ